MPPLPFDNATPHELLSLLAYRPGCFDTSVLYISIDRDPLAHAVHQLPVCATLGELDALPIELLHTILRYSDLRTVSTLRLLNRRARVLVDASVPYKHVLLHAPRVIAALERTGVASHFSVHEIFHALTTSACRICGRFGAFLWIPECIRCCFPCLRQAPELMPMGERDAKAAFGLSKSGLAKVPIVTTLPGTYTLFDTPRRQKRRLLSCERARQVAIVAHGGEEGLARYINSSTSQARIAYERRTAARNATKKSYDSQGRLNVTIDDITRFMTATPLPYFSPTSRKIHVGLSCQGCQVALEKASDQTLSYRQHCALADQRDRTYTEDGIFEHFEECLEAQALWRAR